jgi:hypothetical protein
VIESQIFANTISLYDVYANVFSLRSIELKAAMGDFFLSASGTLGLALACEVNGQTPE